MRCIPLALLLLVCCNDPPPAAQWPGPASPAPMPSVPSAEPASGAPGCGKPARSGASVVHVQAAGKDRVFTLVVPEGYAPGTPYPLVFALHGSGGNGASARSATDVEKQANQHAVFVYPDAGGEWDLNTAADQNPDVAFFDSMLFGVANTICLDRRRVFVTGFSNGAYMANQLGCRRGDRIRGVVTSAGGGPYELSGSYDAQGHLQCNGKPVAALVIHGQSDNNVAPGEGQKSIDHWTNANRCTGGTTNAFVPPCVGITGCTQPVGVCRIPGLGHSVWKSAGQVTWQFVESLR